MKSTLIYYQQKESETNEGSVVYINSLIKQLETHHVIKGVFIDRFNDRSEFYNFINSSPSNINVIFISAPLDKFDQLLLDEVARKENLHIDFNDNINIIEKN